MDRAYERVVGNSGAPGFGPEHIEPPADVYETAEAVIVQIDLPGVRGEVEIEIDGCALRLRGERLPLKGSPNRSYSQVEIVHGPLARDLDLPVFVTTEGSTAAFGEGVLEIVLPKSSENVRRHLRLRLSR